MKKCKTIRDYNIKELLGVGSYGKVFRVTKRKDEKSSFVLKQISLFNMKSDEIKEVKNEAKILSSINSRYIVKYFESWIENTCLNIIMEFCEKGDLSKLIKQYSSNGNSNNNINNVISDKDTGLPEEKIWQILVQMCIGLNYLHSKKILHRDLKTQNILINKADVIKIGDLGVAKALSHTTFAKTFVGTPYYLSPEICEEKPYNEKSDIWALGCCIYQMATLNHPFNASSQPALIMKILRDQYKPISKEYSCELSNLIDIMLEKNHFVRPKIGDIIKNPQFVSKCKQYQLYDLLAYETGYFPSNMIKMNSNLSSEKINISNMQKILSPKCNINRLSNDNLNFQRQKSSFHRSREIKIISNKLSGDLTPHNNKKSENLSRQIITTISTTPSTNKNHTPNKNKDNISKVKENNNVNKNINNVNNNKNILIKNDIQKQVNSVYNKQRLVSSNITLSDIKEKNNNNYAKKNNDIGVKINNINLSNNVSNLNHPTPSTNHKDKNLNIIKNTKQSISVFSSNDNISYASNFNKQRCTSGVFNNNKKANISCVSENVGNQMNKNTCNIGGYSSNINNNAYNIGKSDNKRTIDTLISQNIINKCTPMIIQNNINKISSNGSNGNNGIIKNKNYSKPCTKRVILSPNNKVLVTDNNNSKDNIIDGKYYKFVNINKSTSNNIKDTTTTISIINNTNDTRNANNSNSKYILKDMKKTPTTTNNFPINTSQLSQYNNFIKRTKESSYSNSNIVNNVSKGSFLNQNNESKLSKLMNQRSKSKAQNSLISDQSRSKSKYHLNTEETSDKELFNNLFISVQNHSNMLKSNQVNSSIVNSSTNNNNILNSQTSAEFNNNISQVMVTRSNNNNNKNDNINIKEERQISSTKDLITIDNSKMRNKRNIKICDIVHTKSNCRSNDKLDNNDNELLSIIKDNKLEEDNINIKNDNKDKAMPKSKSQFIISKIVNSNGEKVNISSNNKMNNINTNKGIVINFNLNKPVKVNSNNLSKVIVSTIRETPENNIESLGKVEIKESSFEDNNNNTRDYEEKNYDSSSSNIIQCDFEARMVNDSLFEDEDNQQEKEEVLIIRENKKNNKTLNQINVLKDNKVNCLNNKENSKDNNVLNSNKSIINADGKSIKNSSNNNGNSQNQNYDNTSIKSLNQNREKFVSKINIYKQILLDKVGKSVLEELQKEGTLIMTSNKSSEEWSEKLISLSKKHASGNYEEVMQSIMSIIYYENQLGYLEKEIKKRYIEIYNK